MAFDLGDFSNFGSLSFYNSAGGGAVSTFDTVSISSLNVSSMVVNTASISTLNVSSMTLSNASISSLLITSISNGDGYLPALYTYGGKTTTDTTNNFREVVLPFNYISTVDNSFSVALTYSGIGALTVGDNYGLVAQITSASTFNVLTDAPSTVTNQDINYITVGTLDYSICGGLSNILVEYSSNYQKINLLITFIQFPPNGTAICTFYYGTENPPQSTIIGNKSGASPYYTFSASIFPVIPGATYYAYASVSNGLGTPLISNQDSVVVPPATLKEISIPK